jgi:hypothetical protein
VAVIIGAAIQGHMWRLLKVTGITLLVAAAVLIGALYFIRPCGYLDRYYLSATADGPRADCGGYGHDPVAPDWAR